MMRMETLRSANNSFSVDRLEQQRRFMTILIKLVPKKLFAPS